VETAGAVLAAGIVLDHRTPNTGKDLSVALAAAEKTRAPPGLPLPTIEHALVQIGTCRDTQ